MLLGGGGAGAQHVDEQRDGACASNQRLRLAGVGGQVGQRARRRLLHPQVVHR